MIEELSRRLASLAQATIADTNRQVFAVAREEGWLLDDVAAQEPAAPAEGRLLWAHPGAASLALVAVFGVQLRDRPIRRYAGR